MPDLCLLSDVKVLIDPASANSPGPNDALYAKLITAASAYFLTITNRRNILAESFTETRNGDESHTLILAHTPVLSIDELTIDGQPWIPYAGSGRGFALADNQFQIELVGGRFCRGYRNVAVSYTAGWTEVPADVNQAICEMVLWKKAKMPRIDTSSHSIQPGETISFRPGDVPDTVRGIVRNYTSTGYRGPR